MSKQIRSKWVVLGNISVDAGVIKIGDPCYGECDYDINELIETGASEIPHRGRLAESGINRGFGQAVVLHSGLGDGIYSVEGKYDEKFNAIKEIRIKFF
jgi:hypothetical protein